MVYESSYESGRTPFVPDTKRGYWAQPSDFIYACLGLAFKMDVFSMAWFFFFEMGIFAIFPYLICMALYVVPIVIIQSFLGQFSSSGFISALRVSPLFKGIGYISLGLNLSILTYIGLYGAIPLLYLAHSFRPTLPWSCESFLEWSQDAPMAHDSRMCNRAFQFERKFPNSSREIASENFPMTTTPSDIETTTEQYEHRVYQIPSVMFFRSLFDKYHFLFPEVIDFSLSWQLLISIFMIWAFIAVIFWRCNTMEKIGKLIRYTIWILIPLLLICILRFSFLPGAAEGLFIYFFPHPHYFFVGFTLTPFLAACSFGAGWGAIISLASYNKFNTNIMRYSWLICLGQLLIMILFGLVAVLLDRHFTEITNAAYSDFIESHWIIYLSSGSALANMELPNMWCILFFTLLTLGALLLIVTQLIILLTALFDDFAFLRARKLEVTFGLIGFCALCSIYFCSNHGLTYFTALSADAFFTQTLLNLLLLLVVLWVYGRVRFQRDIEFMLGQPFATWRINVLRFLAPLAILITLVIAISIAYIEHYYTSKIIVFIAIFFVGIPWIFVPGYAVFNLIQTTGSCWQRWLRSCHPIDWYPVDAEDRQRYEEAMGNMDITHQLEEIRAEEA